MPIIRLFCQTNYFFKCFFISIYLLDLFFFTSCSHVSSFLSSSSEDENSLPKNASQIKDEKLQFDYRDGSGDYLLIKEVGHSKKKNLFFVKTKILPPDGKEKDLLEKDLVVSSMDHIFTKKSNRHNGTRSKEISILRPLWSQYTVWLEGKKYFSQMKVNLKKHLVELIASDPESKKLKKSILRMPKGNGIFCFISQLPECIKVTGFLALSKVNHAGKMSLHVIWDGHPHFQQQYENMSKVEAFSSATFNYDGEVEDGSTRYALNVVGQTIFYHFDNNLNLVRKAWVAQGVTQELSGSSFTTEDFLETNDFQSENSSAGEISNRKSEKGNKKIIESDMDSTEASNDIINTGNMSSSESNSSDDD